MHNTLADGQSRFASVSMCTPLPAHRIGGVSFYPSSVCLFVPRYVNVQLLVLNTQGALYQIEA